PNGDPLVLVAQGASRTFNPSLPQSVVDRALERDHASASAEFLAQFRNDLESFVPLGVVQACVGDYVEVSPRDNVTYFSYVDRSGGGSAWFVLAVSHAEEDDRLVVDAIREIRPPFSPQAVIEEYAALLKTYRIRLVVGDRYAGEFPREIFHKLGIAYKCSDK